MSRLHYGHMANNDKDEHRIVMNLKTSNLSSFALNIPSITRLNVIKLLKIARRAFLIATQT